MTNYTLIAYLPGEESWRDRCGDWVGGRDSSLEIIYSTDPAEIATKWGHAMVVGEGEGAEFTLLFDGVDGWDNMYEEHEKIMDRARDERDRIRKEKLERELKAVEARRLKEAEEQEVRQKRDEKLKEERERAELARLQEKYGRF